MHGDQVRKAGYTNINEFISDVVKNYQQIRERSGKSLVLVKGDGKSKIAYIELEPSGAGVYYDVKLGFIVRDKFLESKKRPLLWERGTQTPPTDSGSPAPPSQATPLNQTGQMSPGVRGQSSEPSITNIVPKAENIKGVEAIKGKIAEPKKRKASPKEVKPEQKTLIYPLSGADLAKKKALKSFNPEKHTLLQFERLVGGISTKKSNLAAEIIVRETKEANYYHDYTVIKKGVGKSGDLNPKGNHSGVLPTPSFIPQKSSEPLP